MSPPTSPPTPEDQVQRATAMAELFEELRPVGFALAYRMLGRVHDAEDIVREAFLRLHHRLEDGESIASPRAYLFTVVTRLCIDRVRADRARRDRSVDALPEPLLTAAGDPADPNDPDDPDDSLSLGFLVLLDSLSAEPRAAFLLHEVFDHPYDQIAAIVATSEENARRLVTRALRYVEPRRPRFEPSRERRAQLARRFFAAAQDGDLAALEDLLAADVTLHGNGVGDGGGDGGGRIGALPHPRKGRERVARTLLAWVRATTRYGGFSLREVSVNGQPGAMVLDPSDRLIGVLALEVAEGGRIQAVTSLVDTDRLAHLATGRRTGQESRSTGRGVAPTLPVRR